MTLTYEFVTDSYPYEYNGNTDSWDETEEFEYDPSYSELLEFYNILSKEEFKSIMLKKAQMRMEIRRLSKTEFGREILRQKGIKPIQ